MHQLLGRKAENEQSLPGKKASRSSLGCGIQLLTACGRDVPVPCTFLYCMFYLSASEEEVCCSYHPRSSAGYKC